MKDTKNKMFTYLNGTYTPFGVKTSEFGYTLKLNEGMSETHVNIADENEAIETVENHVKWYKKNNIGELSNSIGEFCRNNKWTRSGT